MKKLVVITVLTAFSLLDAVAQFRNGNSYQNLYDSETVAAMRNHVSELSASYMEGRKAGSEGEAAAAEYVRARFEEYGVDVLSLKGGDKFGLKTEAGDTLTSCNVVGYVQGYDKSLRDHYIVVGARLDNLGTMSVTVDGKPVDRIFYGANGNASGLAMLIELARMVQTNSILFKRSVLFVAFGASSQTYAGAWYLLNRSFKDATNIDAMINLDMLGTGYQGFYAYTSSNADLNALIRTLSGELQPVLPELTSEEPYPSDHRAFYSKQIPSVFFTTGRYPQHNTEKDTQGIISYDMMERELEYIYNFTVALSNLKSAPAFNSSDVSSGQAQGDVIAYFECDQKPQFFGSTDPRHFLREWVYQYLKYPSSSLLNGVQGTVMVEFVVEKDGKVSDVRVIKGVSEELDAEAVKVVSASPKWKPGRVGGNKVRASIRIPVEFRLEKKTGKPSFGIKK